MHSGSPAAATPRLFALDATASTGRRPTILIPAHGTTVVLDPTLPHNGRYIELRATMPAATTQWSSPSLHIIRANSPPDIQVESTFTVEQD